MRQTMLQLEPPLFVITPKGEGRALFLIHNGMEPNMEFLIRHDATGDLYNALISEVRIIDNPMFDDKEVLPFKGRALEHKYDKK